MIKRLIIFNEENTNNRIYLKENPEIPEEVFIYLKSEDVGCIAKIAGFAKTKIVKNEVFINIKFFDTNNGKIAKSLNNAGFSFVAAGMGTINQHEVIENYKMTGVFLINEPAVYGLYKRILLTEKKIF